MHKRWGAWFLVLGLACGPVDPPAPVCGNGTAEAGEECDDGNAVDGDFCEADCALPFCGNGIVDPGEECDPPAAGTCEADCTLPSGTPCTAGAPATCDGSELVTCPAGEEVRTDCTPFACNAAESRCGFCGDGFVDLAFEACDDANTQDGDGCRGDCQGEELCGDGLVDAGEGCDNGAANADTGACLSACQPATCGDGFVRAGVEECDGQNLGGQSCQSLGAGEDLLTCSPGCTFDTSQCNVTTCDPQNDLCVFDEICIVATCEPAFGRSYLFSGITLQASGVDATGGSWDVFGGLPDPKVILRVNGGILLTTASQLDTTNATYSETDNRVLSAGDTLRVQAFEDDGGGGSDDLMVDCDLGAIPASLLRARTVTCATADGTTAIVTFSITPN